MANTKKINPILYPLNPKQQEAASVNEGPVLILAGAGSGKTKTLVHRIANLIAAYKVKPWNILAVTFTNKAAGEIKERVQKLIGKKYKHLPAMGTFHSICVRILRQEIEILGYKKNYNIFDSHDSLSLIKKVMKDLNIDIKQVNPRAIAAIISNAKNELIGPDEYAGQAKGYMEQMVVKVYPEYQRQLKDANSLDFDDLIMKTVQIFQQYPEVLKKYQNLWHYILVDEYQDTNHAQYLFIKLLAEEKKNICAIGDDYQSIYAFRGANYQNILDFEDTFEDTKTVYLEQNYRSTQNILDTANEIISHNKNQKDKKLWTENPKGDRVVVKEVHDEIDEGEYIIKSIFGIDDVGVRNSEPDPDSEITYEPEEPQHQTILEKVMASKTFQERQEDKDILNAVEKSLKKTDLSQYVILYRTNAQSRALEESFLKYGIPYRIIGGIKFYERKEIKDVLAFMRVLSNPLDWVALERLINVPPRGVGQKSWLKIERACRDAGKTYLEITPNETPDVTTRSRQGFFIFQEAMKEIDAKKEKLNPTEILDLIVNKTGMKAFLKDGSEEGERRWENIMELKTVTKKYFGQKGQKSLEAFLEEVALISDQDNIDEKAKAVNMMTIHAAKGLEFPNVFLAGMEEGLFPHSRSLFEPKEMEEERRLCYVALTRAREKLNLIYTSQRTVYGNTQINAPSRFIDDLPKENIEMR
ncbi:UvrD-helicase domain-containing protein [Patescibacteria group bacterium]|nr:UvrD-helicase domain-containing protein [Patescibacteria group bacterium]MBU1673996.1 UvrD-helicase domain-containing protein [Patescibacteria group bacterium]MBU1962931.1 UvrD-helicase domain-containing protein [Patescibacteria group bacterium]